MATKLLLLLAACLQVATPFVVPAGLGRPHVFRPAQLSRRLLQPSRWPRAVARRAASDAASSSAAAATTSSGGGLEAPEPHREDLVTVYWTPGCGFCARAKAALDARGLAWQGVDVGSGPGAAAARQALAQRTGQTSVPQLFVGDARLGGYDDLVALRDSGELEAMVAAKGLLKAEPPTAASPAATAAAASFVDVKALHDPASGVLNVLKSGAVCDAGGSAVEVAADLQLRALELHDNFVQLDGSGVDYEGLARSATTAAFVDTAARLAAVPPSELAALGLDFWINLYNALVMHASVVVGHPHDQASRAAFFSGASGGKYRVGGFDFSLDDLEHGVLRGSPAGDPRAFADGDPRQFLAVAKVDPRIHFALNCGARSCPPVKLFTPQGLNGELQAAAAAFVAAEVSVPDETGEVHLSKLFEWYGRDFAASDVGLLRKLVSYLPYTSRLRPSLLAARGRLVHGYGRITFVYDDYEWAQNDVANGA